MDEGLGCEGYVSRARAAPRKWAANARCRYEWQPGWGVAAQTLMARVAHARSESRCASQAARAVAGDIPLAPQPPQTQTLS
jgi:hypothetical protein